jgi:1-deoxy-D-xylulose-5-phosphate synthase
MADYGDHPTAVRYPRGSSDDRLPEQRSPIQFGRAEVLSDPAGATLTIAAIGSMVSVAYEAAELLDQTGIKAAVINARFIKPVDGETICESARRTGHLITIEENVRRGGFGEAVRDDMHERGLGHIRHKLLALPDAFVEHGTQSVIRADCGLDAASVVAVAKKLMGKSRV